MKNDFIYQQPGFYENIIVYAVSGISVSEYLDGIDNFRYIMCNKAFYEHNNFIKGDITGKLLTDVFPKCRDNGMFQRNLDVVKTGKPIELTLSYFNPQRGNVHQRFQMFRLNENYVVSIFNDITDIKNSEEAV